MVVRKGNMSFSGVAKFFLGFTIAIALMVGAGVAAALYFVTKLTAPPPKPIFANDKPALRAQVSAPNNPTKLADTQKPTPTAKSIPTNSPAGSGSPTDSPSPIAENPAPIAENIAATPTPTESASPKPLEPGAYVGQVTWSSGLSVRSSPGTDGERIGGAAYKQRVIVLAESDDKRWLKIRLEEGDTEGWVKAGNVEKISDSENREPENR